MPASMPRTLLPREQEAIGKLSGDAREPSREYSAEALRSGRAFRGGASDL